MPTTLRLTPTESITIIETTPAVLDVEATYAPGGRPPPKHYHPAQDEHFEVRAGSVRVRAGDDERVLEPGDEIDIPRGTRHQMWNAGDVPAVVRWQTRPAGRTEEWFRGIDGLHRRGRVDGNGMPERLAIATLLSEYQDVIRLAIGPAPVARGVVTALGALGRARGHGVTPGADA